MLKLLLASGVAASATALASPALADVYLNPEYNGANYGDDYLGGTLNLDVGFEGSNGAYSYFIQGGPALVMPNGADNEVEFAGKFGGSVQASEKVSIYGELSGMTGDELSIGTKLGAKYSF
nr:unknown [uncultured Mediterranean phage uvMED]